MLVVDHHRHFPTRCKSARAFELMGALSSPRLRDDALDFKFKRFGDVVVM